MSNVMVMLLVLALVGVAAAEATGKLPGQSTVAKAEPLCDDSQPIG